MSSKKTGKYPMGLAASAHASRGHSGWEQHWAKIPRPEVAACPFQVSESQDVFSFGLFSDSNYFGHRAATHNWSWCWKEIRILLESHLCKVSLCLNESPLQVIEWERPCGIPIKLFWLVNKHENSEINTVLGNSIQGVKGLTERGVLSLIVPCSVCCFPSYILLKSHLATNTHLGFDYRVSSIYMYKIEPTVTD